MQGGRKRCSQICAQLLTTNYFSEIYSRRQGDMGIVRVLNFKTEGLTRRTTKTCCKASAQ